MFKANTILLFQNSLEIMSQQFPETPPTLERRWLVVWIEVEITPHPITSGQKWCEVTGCWRQTKTVCHTSHAVLNIVELNSYCFNPKSLHNKITWIWRGFLRKKVFLLFFNFSESICKQPCAVMRKPQYPPGCITMITTKFLQQTL